MEPPQEVAAQPPIPNRRDMENFMENFMVEYLADHLRVEMNVFHEDGTDYVRATVFLGDKEISCSSDFLPSQDATPC